MEKIIEEKSIDDEEFSLYQLRILEDNFTYILSQNGVCLSIDPGEDGSIKEAMQNIGCSLEAILLTHSHQDHITGAVPLKAEGKLPILGPKHKDLTFLDQEVVDGDEISLGPFSMEVIHSPGHAIEHVMYYFKELNILFCGDVLFIGGCGKMIEGNEHHYYQTLEKIKSLPHDTRLMVGHDYAKRNLEFIRFTNPEFSQGEELETDKYTTIEKELKRNPFLAAKTPHKFKEIYDKREKFRSNL